MIDRLIVIPNNKEVIFRLGKEPDHIILQRIDILKFIHQNIPEFFLLGFQNIRSLTQKIPGVEKHIVKIQKSLPPAFFQVSLIDLSENFIRATLGIIIFQIHPVSLHQADLSAQIFQKLSFLTEIRPVFLRQLTQKLLFLFITENILSR